MSKQILPYVYWTKFIWNGSYFRTFVLRVGAWTIWHDENDFFSKEN